RLYVPHSARADLSSLPDNFRIVCRPWAERSYATRLLWEQSLLPHDVRRWGADVLICLGNFSPLWCKVPVLLLSRNALYFTPRFFSDLVERRHYGRALEYLLLRRLALWAPRPGGPTIS